MNPLQYAQGKLAKVKERVEKLEAIHSELKIKEAKGTLSSDEVVDLEFNTKKLVDLNSEEKLWWRIFKKDLNEIGIHYENFVAPSLAVKYYLKGLGNKEKLIPLMDIYEIDPNDSENNDSAYHGILAKFKVDFSAGIDLPEKEFGLSDKIDPPNAVIHNVKAPKAHHDIILPAYSNGSRVSSPVECNASFGHDGKTSIELEFHVSKRNSNLAQELFLFNVGDSKRETSYDQVAFLNGSGCCHGLSLNLFEMVCKLKSQNHRQ